MFVVKKIFLAILFLANFLAAGRAEESITDGEYEVYSAILRPAISNPGKDNSPITVNIVDSTYDGGLKESASSDDIFVELESIAKCKLDEGLIENFLKKNQTSYELSNKFNLSGCEITLIQKGASPGRFLVDGSLLPGRGSCSEKFSRVGFNPSHNQALVVHGYHCDPDLGEGWLILLMNENGNWKIKGRSGLWIE
jgi:hypothetical protein